MTEKSRRGTHKNPASVLCYFFRSAFSLMDFLSFTLLLAHWVTRRTARELLARLGLFFMDVAP